MLDSGCTQYMTGYVKVFTSLDKDVGDYEHVTFGDNSKGKVVGLGKVAITKDLSISNVLLYPCVGAPTWIRGERQLLDTTGKIWLSHVLYFYFKHLIPSVSLLACSLTRTTCLLA